MRLRVPIQKRSTAVVDSLDSDSVVGPRDNAQVLVSRNHMDIRPKADIAKKQTTNNQTKTKKTLRILPLLSFTIANLSPKEEFQWG